MPCIWVVHVKLTAWLSLHHSSSSLRGFFPISCYAGAMSIFWSCYYGGKLHRVEEVGTQTHVLTLCCSRCKVLWMVVFLHSKKVGLRRNLYLLISAKRDKEGVWEVEVLERSSFMKRPWWFCKKELVNTDYKSIWVKVNCEHKLREKKIWILGFLILRILIKKFWKSACFVMV